MASCIRFAISSIASAVYPWNSLSYVLLLGKLPNTALPHRLKRLFQRRNQILHFLNPNRQTDGIGFNALFLQFFLGALAVGCGGGVDNQLFHIRHIG